MGLVKGPEVYGWEARLYDLLIMGATLGLYPRLIKAFVGKLPLRPGARVLEVGVGTGLNGPEILRRVGPQGAFVGLDVSPDMLRLARRRLRRFGNVRLVLGRAEEPWELGKFDLILVAFVFHGLTQEQREGLLKNARRSLAPGGYLAIVDYGEFDPKKAWLPVRVLIERIECPGASRFVRMNLREYLADRGFSLTEEHRFLMGYLRVALAQPS